MTCQSHSPGPPNLRNKIESGENPMTTQLKSDTARMNGAKSQGPKTAEGRAKFSRNAVKHGLSSRNPVVLECENDDDFQALHNNQMEIHQPPTPADQDLVDRMLQG